MLSIVFTRSLAASTLMGLSTVGIVVLTAIGMFGPVQGGGIDPKKWFGWHPVLMSLAFPCLMTFGRWTYIDERPLRIQRVLHACVMCLAMIAMLFGYLAIFMAHLSPPKFFGYYFKDKAWAEWKRVLHVYIGYTLIVAVIVQTLIGARKLKLLGTGKRTMTFHGKLGKGIIVVAAFNVIIGIRFWGWSVPMKVPMYVLVVLTVLFSVVWPRPSNATCEDRTQAGSLEVPTKI